MNISIQNVDMLFEKGKKALSGISFDMQNPSLIGLLGPNGAGKSTLMKLLVAGILPTSGEILMNGTPLLHSEKKLKSSLGYLPQSFDLYDELTVRQFLDYMAALKGIKDSKSAIRQVIEENASHRKEKCPDCDSFRRAGAAGGNCPSTFRLTGASYL